MGGEGNNLEKFYAELFGWKIMSHNPTKYGIVETGEEKGINGGAGPTKRGGQRVSVYVEVNDIRAALDRAEQLGGRTVLAPSEVPGGPELAKFADPAGNVNGLLLRKKSS